METRELTVSDGAELQRLRLLSLRQCPQAFGSSYEEECEWDKAVYENRIASGEIVYFGAFDGPHLAGMTGLALNHRKKTGHRAAVISVFVEPGHRGRGMGRKLLEAAIVRAQAEAGVEQVALTVVTEQEAAVALYQSLGFVIYGEDPCAIKLNGRSYKEYLMLLELPGSTVSAEEE